MSDGFVVVLVIDLHVPEAGSLKATCRQRSLLKGQLPARVRAAVFSFPEGGES